MVYHVEVNRTRLRFQVGVMSARRLRRVMDYVHDHAVRGAAGGLYSTGRLASSIYKSGPYTTGFKTTGNVGTHLWYARIVESGAEIHNIFPKGAPRVYRFRGAARRRPPQLRFVWRGRVVYTPHVPMSPSTVGRSHPGMKGKHFMLNALMRASLRYRMRILVVNP